jgi:hypothetical protein
MPKDACYHKVKARYKVFPSAYASGAIAKCRKVGAANYGTGGKKKTKKAANGAIIKASNGKFNSPKAFVGQFKNIQNASATGKITHEEAMKKIRKLMLATPKSKPKKAAGGLNAAIKKVKEETMAARDGKAIRKTKRKSKNKNIARGCGKIMSNRRKVTKYS